MADKHLQRYLQRYLQQYLQRCNRLIASKIQAKRCRWQIKTKIKLVGGDEEYENT
ncbi:hypothetical protein NXW94_18945 [Bacteroides ovatus]|nr:hypothetical protein [Bacteroides ovatus]